MSEFKTDHPASSVVYEKTGKGSEEIQTRKHNLPQMLRSVLIVVDGRKNLQAIISQLGAVEESLNELERQGFIAKKVELTGTAALPTEELQHRVEMVKNFMINTTKDSLGPIGSSLIETLKDCKRLQDFQSHFEAYLSAIASGSGKKTAESYREELAALLFPK